VIAAVTNFGVFVELSDLYIEGLMHVSALPGDYYHFDQAKQRLIGERTRQIFQLGGAVTVRVARVDLDDRKIDLELAGVAPAKRGKSGKSGKSSKSGKRRPEGESTSGSRNKKSRRRQTTSSGEKESRGRGRTSGKSTAEPSTGAKSAESAKSKKPSTSGRSAKGSKAGKSSGAKRRPDKKSPAGKKRR
jgi:ribonuclease R